MDALWTKLYLTVLPPQRQKSVWSVDCFQFKLKGCVRNEAWQIYLRVDMSRVLPFGSFSSAVGTSYDGTSLFALTLT